MDDCVIVWREWRMKGFAFTKEWKSESTNLMEKRRKIGAKKMKIVFNVTTQTHFLLLLSNTVTSLSAYLKFSPTRGSSKPRRFVSDFFGPYIFDLFIFIDLYEININININILIQYIVSILIYNNYIKIIVFFYHFHVIVYLYIFRILY